MKIVCISGLVITCTVSLFADRETSSFNEGWRFARYGQMPDGTVKEESAHLEQSRLNDSGWRTVTLPHDWGIEGPFRMELPNQTGKLPCAGIGWYRKHFNLPATDRGHRVFVDFDGAMSHAKVWLNGEYIGEWPYGYSSFRLELTDHLTFDGENILAVRLDNPPDSSRWYPGGGIYRNVRLVKTAPVHVAQWGTCVTSPEVSKVGATIRIATEIENQSGSPANIVVKHEIFEGGETPIKVAEQSVFDGEIKVRKTISPACSITLRNFKRWDVATPNLYYVKTSVIQNGEVVDSCKTDFGIRTIEFIADKGFLLNGRHMKMQGVCLHSDLGPLGAAVNVRAIERQLEIMKEMGCNAIRTSHNPPAPELLELCDRMGMLVMEEAFDCWAFNKKGVQNGYGNLFKDWHERDLAAMVHRDRNHPSVVIWSTGNEVSEEWPWKFNPPVSSNLTAFVHGLDPTRPVTVACAHPDSAFKGFAGTVDVFGYNYKPYLYYKFRKTFPGIPLFGSETAACISSRGEYFFPITDTTGGCYQVNGYDMSSSGAHKPETEFQQQTEFPELLGQFVWTGFDYLGEAYPYNKQPNDLPRSSYFGIVDLCGFPKDRFYLYQSQWRPDFPMAHILPHWNWPERTGQITPVHVYTSGDEAELFLNGKSLGRKKMGKYEYRLRWDDVVYQPGELKVVAYRNGQPWAEDVVRTTGLAAKVELVADRATIKADGLDLAFITVEIADASGSMVPRSDNLVKFSLTGPGEIIAVGNGNPASHESFQAHERKAFNGLCLVVVRSRAGQPGAIALAAESAGLERAAIEISSR